MVVAGALAGAAPSTRSPTSPGLTMFLNGWIAGFYGGVAAARDRPVRRPHGAAVGARAARRCSSCCCRSPPSSAGSAAPCRCWRWPSRSPASRWPRSPASSQRELTRASRGRSDSMGGMTSRLQPPKRTVRAWLSDMDGVLVHEEEPIPGAADFIARLTGTGRPFLLLTNNSIYTPRDLKARLHRSGIDVPEDAIWTSALATAQFLDDQRPGGYGVRHRRGRADHRDARDRLRAVRAGPGVRRARARPAPTPSRRSPPRSG